VAGDVESVLKNERAWAARLREDGFSREAQLIENTVVRVSAALADYLTWLPERFAMKQTGKSQRWLRSRYSVWEAAGHAQKRKGVRHYRAVVLPIRSKTDEMFEAGFNAVSHGGV
jgi:hypothetical protein